MVTLRKHLALVSLLSLTGFANGAQQTAAKTGQPSGNQNGSPSSTLTADGVPSCSGGSQVGPPPEVVKRIGGGLLSPVAIKTPEAKFSDESRKYARSIIKAQHLKRFEAKSLVRLTVDTNGLPQDICVLNEAGHGLDRGAFDAVAKYRFKPATRDGNAVPVRLTVEVNWALW